MFSKSFIHCKVAADAAQLGLVLHRHPKQISLQNMATPSRCGRFEEAMVEGETRTGFVSSAKLRVNRKKKAARRENFRTA